ASKKHPPVLAVPKLLANTRSLSNNTSHPVSGTFITPIAIGEGIPGVGGIQPGSIPIHLQQVATLVTGVAGVSWVKRVIRIVEITRDKESFVSPGIHSCRKAVQPVAFSRIVGQQSKLIREMDSKIVGRLDVIMHLAADL